MVRTSDLNLDNGVVNASLGVATGLACGVVLGWILRGRISSKKHSSVLSMKKTSSNHLNTMQTLKNIESSAESVVDPPAVEEPSLSLADDGDYKLVLVVRKDLAMGKGKAAAQCCHATADVIKKLIFDNPEMLIQWEKCGQPKVVVKADDEQTLLRLHKEARKLGLVTSIISDAGRTQIAAGSKTVLGVGPVHGFGRQQGPKRFKITTYVAATVNMYSVDDFQQHFRLQRQSVEVQ